MPVRNEENHKKEKEFGGTHFGWDAGGDDKRFDRMWFIR